MDTPEKTMDEKMRQFRRAIQNGEEKGMDIDKELEECWKEYENAPPLSEEELDRMIKDYRQMYRNRESERSN